MLLGLLCLDGSTEPAGKRHLPEPECQVSAGRRKQGSLGVPQLSSPGSLAVKNNSKAQKRDEGASQKVPRGTESLCPDALTCPSVRAEEEPQTQQAKETSLAWGETVAFMPAAHSLKARGGASLQPSGQICGSD